MEDYYSLDLLLAENQKIPCMFNILVPGMGYLEGTNERDIHPHTSIELPCWLVNFLSQNHESNYLAIQIPKAFNSNIRHALSASAKSVNLKNISTGSNGAWYESGKVLLGMIEDKNLQNLLHKTLSSRLNDIADLAARSNLSEHETNTNRETDEFLSGLDAWERQILTVGQQTAKRMRAWEKGRAG